MSPKDSVPAVKLSSEDFASKPYTGTPMRLPRLADTAFSAAEYVSERQERPRKNFNQLLRTYVLADLVGLHAGFVMAWVLASLVNSAFFGRSLLEGGSTIGMVRVAQFLAIAMGVILWFQHTGHYRLRMPFWMEARSIIITMSFAMMMDGFLQFTSKQDFSRLCLIAGWLIAGVVIILARYALRSYYRRTGKWKVATLVVGEGMTAQDTLSAMRSEPGLGYEVVAQIKDLPSAFMQAGRSWENLCREYEADYVIIALDGKDLANSHQPIAQLMREEVPFSVSAPLHHLPVLGMMPQYFLNHDVMLFARSSGLEQPIPRFLKRTVDILLSGCALIALSPVMVIVALMVKRDGGPAFFGHSRIGRNGRKFRCLKFRSMVMNGDAVLARVLAENPEAKAEWDETQKLKNDPRVTWIGNILRSTSLDELPQLFNVLMGEMSLVGPRPIVTAEVQKYESDIAHYYRVRPGITGLWQVSGRSDVTYAQRVQMDCWYVRNWSLWHDIAIICKTFPALLKRSGAY
jgi:Undecaprenyl-phosphate galactose phosphotransferase WbaP